MRKQERGYALLAVLLMAALIAFYVYAQLPRVAFESERDKEQTLIDRGEQYKRAIQLYVNAVKKYPQKIEDLENTNEKRYLRKRYIDPYTGKDEWRLIHVNAAGVLTDSLVQKPPAAPGANGPTTGGPLSTASGTAPGATPGSTPGTSTPGTSTDPNAAANGTAPADPNDVNAAVRKRPSDVVGNAYTQQGEADPNNPATWAPITITAPAGPNGTAPAGQPPSGAVGFNGGLLGQGQPGVPGQPGTPGQPGAPGGFPLPGQPGFNPTQNQFKVDSNGQLVPVTPTQPGAVINSQNGGVQNTPFGAQPQGGLNSSGASNPAGNGIAAQNAATQAIQNLLTNPNPQPGAGGLGTSAGMTTGGIAGVASMYKGPSIKIYGGRQKYQEWEFIFKLDNGNGAGGQQANPLQPGQNGLNPQNPQNPGQGNTPAAGSTTGQATTPANPGNQ